MAQYINRVGYGLTDALPNLAPFPIKANRAPIAADKGFPVGQLWIYSALNAPYILTSIVNNAAVWELLTVSGGAGVFSTLTSSADTTLATGTGTVNTFGNILGATSLSLLVGTGNFSVDGVAASTYSVGASAVAGTITIGGTGQTGTITLGSSSGTNIVNVAAGAGASTVNIANAQVAGAVNVGAGMTTGTISIGGTGLQTGTITVGGGTGAQTVNLGTGGTGIKTVNIATGSAANAISIGTTQTAGSITMGSAMTTGIIVIGSSTSGLVSVPFVNASAAGGLVVNNVRVGQAIYTGLTTASGANETITLNNVLISATSSIFLTVSNLGSNDAQMTLQRVLPSAGVCTIILKNNGAAALNGNVQVSFWVN